MRHFTSVVYQTHHLVSAEDQEPFRGEDPRKAGVYETRAWQFLSVHQDGVIETVNSRDCDPQAFIE